MMTSLAAQSPQPIESECAVSTLAGTTWNCTSSRAGTLTFVFGTGCDATMTAPNGATHTFIWAESSDGSGHFWMNESSETTQNSYLYLLVGSTNGETGQGILVNTAPEKHEDASSPFTMSKQ